MENWNLTRARNRFGDIFSYKEEGGSALSREAISTNDFSLNAVSDKSASSHHQLHSPMPSLRPGGLTGEDLISPQQKICIQGGSDVEHSEQRLNLLENNQAIHRHRSGTFRLNPATAAFIPMGKSRTGLYDFNLQHVVRSAMSRAGHVLSSSTADNNKFVLSPLQASDFTPATTFTEQPPQRNQVEAGSRAALISLPARPQKVQLPVSSLPTGDLVTQTEPPFDNNKVAITNMSANSQGSIAQDDPQIDQQQIFPSQSLPYLRASSMQQPLSHDNQISGDGQMTSGPRVNFNQIEHQTENHQSFFNTGTPMGQQGRQNQNNYLPSAPAAHDQAAMDALQAHLSRVEIEQEGNRLQNFQTPVRIITTKSSSTRMTPSSYRFTPRSGLDQAEFLSPNNSQAGDLPSRTEPRNFAPRSNDFDFVEQPPRFNLQMSVPMSHNDPHSMSTTNQQYANQQYANQQYGDNGAMSSYLTQQQQAGFGDGIRVFPPRFDGDPFRSAPSELGKYGNMVTDLIRPTQTSLSHVIKPIEPLATALAMQNHPVPEYIRRQRSKQLNELTAAPNARPTAETALHAHNFPFVEGARCAQPSQHHGIVKLKNVSLSLPSFLSAVMFWTDEADQKHKQIPFCVRRSEIIAFLGRNSKILNDIDEPVHIIMERVTTKTNDAYVEFMTPHAAIAAVDRHLRNTASGRHARLGDRPVEIELSSQSALMKDLFPLAKGVRWDGAEPVILEDHPTEPWNCFKGFITEEEMTMLVKHVEVPQRVSPSRKFWLSLPCDPC